VPLVTTAAGPPAPSLHACQVGIVEYLLFAFAYRSLNGRWYALVDGERFIPSWRFSRNQEVVPFHVLNATDFLDSVKWRVVPGDTILFDFIFFIHPTAIGHWWEMLGPLYR
jgi:hypothetical protein